MVSNMGAKKIMKKRVVYLSLDERPCNYTLPQNLFKDTPIELIVPPLEIMGDKKKAGNFEKIKDFLLNETKDAFGLVIAIDALLYGGIVPSRLHHEKPETLLARLEVLKQIKEQNPNIIIHAFQLIMRTPRYSLSDEEPDYYDVCGKEIFQYGYYTHLKELNLLTKEQEDSLNLLNIKQEYLDDYLFRRNINLQLNIKTLDYVMNNVIDFLVIPQDDSAEYGFPSMDQGKIKEIVYKNKLMLKVYIYHGADEVGSVLISRMLSKVMNYRPLVYIKYPIITAGKSIPCLEDRYLDTSVKYQIIASGGLVATSAAEADYVLFVSSGENQQPTPEQNKRLPRDITTLRNMPEVIEFINYCVQINKPVVIADITYLNGGDLELLQMIESKGLTMKLAGYAGWNTAANTLGTAVSQGMAYPFRTSDNSRKEFLYSRYIEDIGYCSIVRSKVKAMLNDYGYNYFDVEEQRGIISKIVKEELQEFANAYLPSVSDEFNIEDVYMPWRRMFEVGFKIQYKGRE